MQPIDPSPTAPSSLSDVEVIVLGLVRAAGSATPYDLKRGVAGSLGYFWDIPHSQLYATPERLARRGFVEVDQEPDGRRRKRYSITAPGEEALERWIAAPPVELPQTRNSALLAIFFGADPRLVAQAQIPLHEARLAEYEAIDAIGRQAPAGTDPGPLIALQVGIAGERLWLDYYRGLLSAAPRPPGTPPTS